jgi:hypothetical protein
MKKEVGNENCGNLREREKRGKYGGIIGCSTELLVMGVWGASRQASV